MLKRTMVLLVVLCAVFIIASSCKDKPKPNDPTQPDTLVPPKGKIRFSLLQYGDTLGTLDIYEDRHNIVLENALHVDSLLMGRMLSFSFIGSKDDITYQGIDPYVFVFIQSINPNIEYNDFLIIHPDWYGNIQKANFGDIKDSIFYCEAFFCMFDFDDEHTGANAIILSLVNDDLSFTFDTILVDAALHTVVLDSAVYLDSLVVDEGPDIYMQYCFWGEYENRENRVFLLTKFEGLAYDPFYCGLFGAFPGGEWSLKPLANEIERIVAFWPVIPTKYTNHFWKKIYNYRYQ